MNVLYILDLLFLKNHEDLFKYLSRPIYFSKETFVTQISASGGPWNISFLDEDPQPNTCNFGVLDTENLRTTDLEEVFRRQNRGQNFQVFLFYFFSPKNVYNGFKFKFKFKQQNAVPLLKG